MNAEKLKLLKSEFGDNLNTLVAIAWKHGEITTGVAGEILEISTYDVKNILDEYYDDFQKL